MSREQLISRVVEKLRETAEVVTNTDLEVEDQVLSEIQAFSDLFTVVKNHFGYLGAMHPDGAVQLGLANAYFAIGEFEKAAHSAEVALERFDISPEERAALVNDLVAGTRRSASSASGAIDILKKLA